jgi:hypothetical protein
VLGALADAAEAAAKAGRPLPLHTLRVLWAWGTPALPTIKRLLSYLHNLHTLELHAEAACSSRGEHLAPLKRSKHLRELFVATSWDYDSHVHSVAKLLPAGLQRLSWQGGKWELVPDLSHLTGLQFLHLHHWPRQEQPLTSKLPPGLQELQLSLLDTPLGALEPEKDILTRYDYTQFFPYQMACLPYFPKVQHVHLHGNGETHAQEALKLLGPNMSSMYACVSNMRDARDLQPLLSSPGTFLRLRRLRLSLRGDQVPPVLAPLTQVTHLQVEIVGASQEEQQAALVAGLGGMPQLRWLSVPEVLLLDDQAWLGGLQQLQVLVLVKERWPALRQRPEKVLQQVVEGLEGCSPQDLPPRLLLLGFSSMTVEQAAAWQVRRRLQHLTSSGFEVVLGVDLDEVCDPVKQLAGVPVGLQQALA